MKLGFPALVFIAIAVFVVDVESSEDDNTALSLKSDSRLGIRPRDVSRSETAIRLAQVVEEGYKAEDINTLPLKYGFDPFDGMYLESGIDSVYLARVGDKYCGVAFRGTTNYQPEDWFSNFQVEPVPFSEIIQQQQEGGEEKDTDTSSGISESLQDCDMHRGFYEAYTNFEYRDVVEDFLATCRFECVECETILTGHSQGGAIAAIAAVYLKYGSSNETEFAANTDDTDYDSPYVITFGAPPSLGAGCYELFPENERKRWFRHITAREQENSGKTLVYDPIPLLFIHTIDPQEVKEEDESSFFDIGGLFELDKDETFVRNGGLAYIGFEILLSTGDPSSVFLSEFDSHRYVSLKYIDYTFKAHFDWVTADLLKAQNEIYNINTEDCRGKEESADDSKISNAHKSTPECLDIFVPSNGFAVGSRCNAGESESSSTCAQGLVCTEEEAFWFWNKGRYTCQPVGV